MLPSKSSRPDIRTKSKPSLCCMSVLFDKRSINLSGSSQSVAFDALVTDVISLTGCRRICLRAKLIYDLAKRFQAAFPIVMTLDVVTPLPSKHIGPLADDEAVRQQRKLTALTCQHRFVPAGFTLSPMSRRRRSHHSLSHRHRLQHFILHAARNSQWNDDDRTALKTGARPAHRRAAPRRVCRQVAAPLRWATCRRLRTGRKERCS